MSETFNYGQPYALPADGGTLLVWFGAHFLVFNTPGGFEKMFTLGPKTPEEAERAMAAYGMTVLGPHPRQASAA
jgi:hypothetical protein